MTLLITYLVIIAILLPMWFGLIKRNILYGFRTPLSMQSEDNWRRLNKWAAIHLFIVTAIFLALHYFSNLQQTQEAIAFALVMILMSIYLIARQNSFLSKR